MVYALVCAAAFALFGLYDVNGVLWKKKALQLLFPAGCLLLLGAWGGCLGASDIRSSLWLIPGALFGGLTAYALFFALPFEKTYVRPEERPGVYDRGAYALCRHPGVLFYGLCALFLGLAWNSRAVWICAGVSSVLNVCYVVLQDVWTFPRSFRNYPEYRDYTPFLIPTPKSIRRAWQTRR